MDRPSLAASSSTNSVSSEASSASSSGRNSPTTEQGFLFSGASTPATERSVLFGSASTSPSTSSDDFILVVGGLGYIGSHTSWELLRSGQNVIIIDNLGNSSINVLDKLKSLRDDHFPIPSTRPLLDFYQADYRDTNIILPILTKYNNHLLSSSSASTSTIRGVIHFAAYKAVAESFQQPLSYYSNNVSGLITFCTTLSSLSIKTLIFSSSATVYGSLADAGTPLLETQVDHTACVGLTNPYGRTKWMCEAILHDLAVSDPEWTIVALRYFNPIGCDASGVLGEDPTSAASNLMPIVVQAMTGARPALSVFGTDWDTRDGTAIRDFIHVSDLATGHLAALEATKTKSDVSRFDATKTGPLGTGYHVFNLGTGDGHSVKEIVREMEAVSGRIIPTVEIGRREGDVGVCVAGTEESKRVLGWKTKKTLREACWDICRYIGYVGGEQEKSISEVVEKCEIVTMKGKMEVVTISVEEVSVEA